LKFTTLDWPRVAGSDGEKVAPVGTAPISVAVMVVPEPSEAPYGTATFWNE
jgi:hypothetical protein